METIKKSVSKKTNTSKTPIKKTARAKKVEAIETPGEAFSLPENNQSVNSKISFFKENLNKLTSNKFPKKYYLGLLAIGIVLLLAYKKDLIIAATVNGAPISNFEVLNRMSKLYHERTLNQMINEKIILDEARKRKIFITTGEIDNKIKEWEGNVGGAASLDSLLAQQGQTREDLRQQVRIQLTVEKMYATEASVSAEEVSQFVETNKDQLQATDPEGQEKEATEILKQQKLPQIFNDKFNELKQKSQVKIF